MKQLFITFDLFISIFSATAFTSHYSYATQPLLRFENEGGLSRDYLTDGKVKVRAGVFGSYDLREMLKDDPIAFSYAEQHLQYDTKAKLSYWLGSIPSSCALGVSIALNSAPGTYISLGAFIGSLILMGHYQSASRHYLYKAINTHNGLTVLDTTSTLESTKLFTLSSLSPNTIGFSFGF